MARDKSGAGGEMASSETEASPPSRRRPPRFTNGFATGNAGPNWTNHLPCHTFVIILLGPIGARQVR
ncbi:hypothetical protein ARTHRO9AX_20317 [Arthrobacter sp. 9AX]|nr:hypothetical protein ARTHRO9AX_20317 [Arthrobacter sp. 9AX]